jgi:hypothetical protein
MVCRQRGLKIKPLPPECLVDFLAARRVAAQRHAEIADRAARYGGSIAGLDPELEAAEIEQLLASLLQAAPGLYMPSLEDKG